MTSIRRIVEQVTNQYGVLLREERLQANKVYEKALSSFKLHAQDYIFEGLPTINSAEQYAVQCLVKYCQQERRKRQYLGLDDKVGLW